LPLHVHQRDFVRWESSSKGSNLPLHELSSEGSDCRCKFDSNFDYDFDSTCAAIFLHGFALTVLLNRTEPATPNANTAGYAKNLVIDRKRGANSVCVASAAHQDTQQPNVRKQDAANAAARLTKAL
jgi:hypothetical protein